MGSTETKHTSKTTHNKERVGCPHVLSYAAALHDSHWTREKPTTVKMKGDLGPTASTRPIRANRKKLTAKQSASGSCSDELAVHCP